MKRKARTETTRKATTPPTRSRTRQAHHDQDELFEEITRRAHEIYLEHGCEEGHCLDHWLMAEQEVLHHHGA